MEGINEIIGNLSDDDISRLKNLANDLFGSGEKNDLTIQKSGTTDISRKEKPKSEISSDMFDPATLKRIMGVVSSLNGNPDSDDRAKFIASLKPLLSDKRKQKADEAVKMMHLFEILPALKESGLF